MQRKVGCIKEGSRKKTHPTLLKDQIISLSSRIDILPTKIVDLQNISLKQREKPKILTSRKLTSANIFKNQFFFQRRFLLIKFYSRSNKNHNSISLSEKKIKFMLDKSPS